MAAGLQLPINVGSLMNIVDVLSLFLLINHCDLVRFGYEMVGFGYVVID